MQPGPHQWQASSLAALLQPPDAGLSDASSCYARAPCAAGPHLLPCVVLSPPSPRPQKLSVTTQPTQRVLCRLPQFILPSYVAAVPRLYRPWVSLLQVWCAAGRMGACLGYGAGCYGCHLYLPLGLQQLAMCKPGEVLLVRQPFRHVCCTLQQPGSADAAPSVLCCTAALVDHWCCWAFTSSIATCSAGSELVTQTGAQLTSLLRDQRPRKQLC
jgi:hypothetical protein